MRIQDIYVKTYYRLVGKSKLLRPFRLAIRSLANLHLKMVFRNGNPSFSCTGNEDDVIVSLTSFPARINNLWIVVESLLRQSVRPQRIMIWLSKEQFTDKSVPRNLKSLEARGVEIKLVDGDIRSHKKYYYIFKERPNSKILLADDDIIYPSDMVERLLTIYDSSPHRKKIAHVYGYEMKYNSDGELKPYDSWGACYKPTEGYNLFFGSGGGTLLKPSDLYADVINVETARLLAPQADDVWLNAMARLGGCYYHKISNGPILSVQNRNNETLANSNLSENQNDVQIKNVIDYFQNMIGRNPYKKYED